MHKFLVKPFQSTGVSTVIVIDALNECRDEDPESAILLLVLGQLVHKIPRINFFVTSWPEMYITAGFCGPLLQGLTNVFILHKVKSCAINSDIHHFCYQSLHNDMVVSKVGQQMNSLTHCVRGWLISSYMLLQQSVSSTTNFKIPQVVLV